jgi:outer membrane protein OmpA-like peptidoglycan-associated protein
MMDDGDDGARVGLWATLGVVTLLLFGLIAGLAIRHAHKQAPKAVALVAAAGGVAAGPAVAGLAPDELKDVELTGVVAGTLYFATGSAALANDAGVVLSAIRDVAAADSKRNLLISGFHDATGDPTRNAELAKERAKAVREALVAAGVDRARIVMRKPEVLVGGADNAEARRVEVRAVD